MTTTDDWADLDDRAREVLRRWGGIAPTSAFDEAKITRLQLGALVGRGVLERVRRGWFVDPEAPWQVKAAARVGGVVAGVTAAELWGLPVPPGSRRRLHVLVDEHGSRFRHHRDSHSVLMTIEQDPDVRFHWSSKKPEVVDGRTGLLETLLLLVTLVPFPWAVAALDAALHVPRGGTAMLAAHEFERFRALLPAARRALVDAVDPRAESCIETLLRLGLVARGILDFTLQAVPHPAYRVDLLVRGRLVIEVDGAAFHDPARDARRDAELRALGYVVLRFSYDRVVFDLEGVLDEIEATLSSL